MKQKRRQFNTHAYLHMLSNSASYGHTGHVKDSGKFLRDGGFGEGWDVTGTSFLCTFDEFKHWPMRSVFVPWVLGKDGYWRSPLVTQRDRT